MKAETRTEFCASCGTEKTVLASYPQCENYFCDRHCISDWHKKNKRWVGTDNPRYTNKVVVNCSFCGKEKHIRPSEHKYKNYFCNKKCKYKWSRGKNGNNWRGGAPKYICKHCGETFSVARFTRNSGKGKFCSVKCMGDFQKGKPKLNIRGENNPHWKGGTSSARDKMMNSLEYKEWRFMVFGRDDFTCQMCRERGVYLHAHHIRKFAEYPLLRLAVSNGITLCRECHNKTVGHEEEYAEYFDACLKDPISKDLIS